MKNRIGIIKMNHVVVKLMEDDESLAKALFSNFFPDEIITDGNGKTYIGNSPLFREIEDNETIPLYDCEGVFGVDGKFTFVGFHEIDVEKECDKLKSENSSLKKCFEEIANLCQKIVTLTDEKQTLKYQLEKETEAHKIEIRNLETNLKNWKERCKIFERMANTHYGLYELDEIEKSIMDYSKLIMEGDEIIPKLERFKNSQETIRKKNSIFESWFK